MFFRIWHKVIFLLLNDGTYKRPKSELWNKFYELKFYIPGNLKFNNYEKNSVKKKQDEILMNLKETRNI